MGADAAESQGDFRLQPARALGERGAGGAGSSSRRPVADVRAGGVIADGSSARYRRRSSGALGADRPVQASRAVDPRAERHWGRPGKAARADGGGDGVCSEPSAAATDAQAALDQVSQDSYTADIEREDETGVARSSPTARRGYWRSRSALLRELRAKLSVVWRAHAAAKSGASAEDEEGNARKKRGVS